MISTGEWNGLDIVLAIVLGLSLVGAARRGFSREIIGLSAAIFALVAGMWFYGLAGSLIAPYASNASIANLAGFLLVVFAVLITGSLVGWIVSRFISTIGLSFFDRLLGAVFGLVRGIFICIAILTAFIAFGPHVEAKTTPGAVVHSRLAPLILEASHVLVAMAPMELKSSFRKQYDQVESEILKVKAAPSPQPDTQKPQPDTQKPQPDTQKQ